MMPATVAPPVGLIAAMYIRESAGDANNDVEMEGQRLTCRRLAERDGVDPDALVEYNDWGYSGTRITRPAYVRLRADIAEGTVGTVYARSVDRLGRDVDEGIAFEQFARVKGTRVVTDRDGERTGDPDDQNVLVRYIPHLIAAEESRLGRRRAKDARSTRLRNVTAHRGACTDAQCPDSLHWDGVQPFGTLPGEDVALVIAAFETAGSYSGAAKALNETGAKPRRGDRWESTSVMRVVKRFAEANPTRLATPLPVRKHRGSKTMTTHIFARLIICPHDGSVLTATNRTERSGPAVGYFCRQGRQAAVMCPEHGSVLVRQADWTWSCPSGHELNRYDVTSEHPRPWSVSERPILTAVREAMALRVQVTRHASVEGASEDTPGEVAAIEAKRHRLGQVYVDGLVSDEDYRSRLAAIEAELERLQVVVRKGHTFRMGVAWHLTPSEVNAQLRDVLHSVRLDHALKPTGAVWLEQPTVRLDDESDAPHPGAVRVAEGWYLDFEGVG